MATLLSIVQTVFDELGLDRPSSVATNRDLTVRQIFALINREGRTLVKACAWPQLATTATITTVSGTSDYDYPDDFDRLIDSTQWDRTNGWEMLGPENPQTDRWRRESTAAQASIRRYFRHYGSFVRLYPTPAVSGDTLVYEYVSKNWAETAAGTGIAAMTADTDVPLLDEQIFILGAIWRFKSAKGFAAEADKKLYDDHLASLMSAEIGGGVLSMEPRAADGGLIDLSNVPDSGYAL